MLMCLYNRLCTRSVTAATAKVTPRDRAQTGMSPVPEGEAIAAAGVQRGATVRPGAGIQPGASIQPGAGIQPGASIQPDAGI
jgi:UDP-3-O-[3-hydroxymyristoyl] glucosamine N-acyltransferase